MRAIIVGGGKLGTELARMLAEQGSVVTMLEVDEERCAVLRDSLKGPAVVCGDGDDPLALEAAGIRGADAIVAVTGEDEDYLVVTLLAKREYGVPFTAARVNDPRNEWLFTDEFGVDTAVSGTTVMADLLDKVVVGRDAG